MANDEFDTILDSLSSTFEERKKVERDARNRENEERQSFLSAFRDKIQNVIRPVFDHTQQKMLASTADLKVDVKIDPNYNNITLATVQAERHWNLSISADYEKKRVTVRNELSPLGPESLLVEEISDARVKKEVVDFLQRMTRK